MIARAPILGIITHWSDALDQRRYLVKLMAKKWEAAGSKIIVVKDCDPFIPADLAFIHTDLSVVPESVRRLAARYPRVINGAALDIRKRRFSELLVNRDDPFTGKVIVKTDCNSGGGQEFRMRALSTKIGRLLCRLGGERFALRCLTAIERTRSWKFKRVLGFSRYPVYENIQRVPEGVWQNPNLIVERFLPERDGPNYCCRHWLFLGPKEVTRRTVSRDPIVKVGEAIQRTNDVIPDELRQVRTRLGFDYGKFDYAIVDGRPILYDVNRTPGAAADPRSHAETVSVLSEGLFSFSTVKTIG